MQGARHRRLGRHRREGSLQQDPLAQARRQEGLMRPQLLIDADGVLVDFTKTTLDVVHDLTGVRVDPKSITTWEVFESLPVELQARKEEGYRIIRGEGVCRAMAALECAEAGLDSISGIADITVVTSPFRPSRT